MRGLTSDEHGLLVSLGAACGGRPGDSDDWTSFTSAEERMAERLTARGLLAPYECGCGYEHHHVTALGRLALSISAQLEALYGPGKAA